jgi:hypothetical protein
MIFTNPIVPPVLDLGSADPRARLQAVRQITRQLSVPGVLDTLRQHRLTPLIYQTLTQFTRKEVGEVPLLRELRGDYLGSLRLYHIQESETGLLVEVLAAAGVEVILLKGADIRHRLYEDPACRPMSDVDVLISPADLERARTALEQQGYTLMPRDLDLRPGFTAQFGWVITYKTPRGGIPFVDVHWEIQEAGTFYRLPYNHLRARATVQELGGLSALVLAPEHVVMHLCLHTFDELEYNTILKIVDLERALHRFSLDWDLLLDDASRFRVQEPILWIFRDIEHVRPGLVPALVLEQLAAHRPGWAERFILRRQRNTMLVASLMALWHHLPAKAWPAYLQAKIWPSRAYLDANARDFSRRTDYLNHILGRARERT